MPAPSFRVHCRAVAATVLLSSIAVGCTRSIGASASVGTSAATASARGTPSVGPRSGSVMVVGGGQMGPEVYAKFIELAGGPDALIIDVPTAGGDTHLSSGSVAITGYGKLARWQ